MYISDGTWFKKGSMVKLVTKISDELGIFSGMRVCENESEGHLVGTEYLDEETCGFDEFEEVNECS
jgi:hypothetical protein